MIIIVGILFSFVLTLVLLPILIKFASTNKLFVPINYRRSHKNSVSALGGIAIFASTLLSILFFSDMVEYMNYRFIFGSAFLLFFIGLRDDLFDIQAIYKLLGQAVSVSILVFFANVQIHFFQHFYDFSLVYFLDNLFTVFFLLLIINAYNMIDGTDLLAAVIGLVFFTALGIWFFYANQIDYSLLLMSLAASLLAFMVFNFSPAKIFMGDTGTMTIGLIMGISIIKMDEINAISISKYNFEHSGAIAFSLTSLLIIDLIRVSLSRILRSKSPFIADKNHIHHLLLRLGLKHNAIAFLLAAFVIFQLSLSLFLDKYLASGYAVFGVNVIVVGLFYASILYLLRSRKTKN